LEAPGPSGYEQASAALFREAAGAFAEIVHDTVGSTVARVKGTGDGPFVAVVGDTDGIGLIVTDDSQGGARWTSTVTGRSARAGLTALSATVAHATPRAT
jgi:putative aminopeptidase FrvX